MRLSLSSDYGLVVIALCASKKFNMVISIVLSCVTTCMM